MAYDHKSIEPKWQKNWEDNQVFRAETGSAKPKYYVLDMFPYPSSSGLHVGHPEGYTASDIVCRYKRAKGFNVLHPMGWDAFGLPAEQYALQTGVHPAITTAKAIETFRRQLKSLGFSFDWSREVATCDPKYYKWTQYIFLKLYERGLAYQKEVPVNWCPALKTVLANEEVVDGKSERGSHPVYRVPMKQWMLKITSYAERLLKDLDKLDWPESTKELQRNWIGKSEGLQCRFPLAEGAGEIEIFTTRPDTIFGATFMVLAPEHPLVNEITTEKQRETVKAYQEAAARKSEIARQEESKEKTGVFTGAFALNPLTTEKIPVWIADYVMMSYGTGAIMAVPAHDERDAQFAQTYQLPVIQVIEGGNGEEFFSGDGVSINSGFITGMPTAQAKEAVIGKMEADGRGTRAVQYKLRDWLFSRQRYWGEPFPILHLEGGGKSAVPLEQLPVVLPQVQSYEPTGTGESPLAAISEWVNTVDSSGKPARRETDTMPGSAGSSWYFLRYCDPDNEKEPISAAAEKYWMPVDLYVGGPEHAVGHLLYARFWTKVLFDAGLLTHDEPFQKLLHQGMILGEDGEKMSKSRGNVINPDIIVEKYGADTLRMYEMFMGPIDRDKPWNTSAIEGVYRFLQRSWRIFLEDEDSDHPTATKLLVTDSEPSLDDLKITHKTIKKVTEDIENLRFNTAISQMMVFVNHMTKLQQKPRKCLRPFIQLLNPFAPHIAEELWEKIGETTPLTYASWPAYDPALAKDDLITIAVQVMGKTRGTIEMEPGSTQEAVEKAARENTTVARQLEGKEVKKVIFVKDKILNFVAT
ncbi:MAG: leucine--tRNA ligase [Bdellovibrionales bacterium GWB1_55_8]|nr:MAG: leucine--tRNA ligase [Bdellovibrionales bacterium GWB1_55_8]